MTIHPQIREAIQPVLDRADALLDHYTEGLPREAWEPLAIRLAAAGIGHWITGANLVNGPITHTLDQVNRHRTQSAFYSAGMRLA